MWLTPGSRCERFSKEKESQKVDLFCMPGAKRLSEREMTAHASTFIIAGSETTATALLSTMYWIVSNPRVHKKLQAEIRSAFDTAGNITGESTNRLPYLKAVIEESLRMYPPVGLGGPRYSPGSSVDGHYIPEGVSFFLGVSFVEEL
jgi:cytochrome P450